MPGVEVRWSGSLLWDEENEEEVGERPCLLPGEQFLDAGEVGRLEPHLAESPARARPLRSDGAIDPVAVTQALVRAARSHGARLLATCAVTALRVCGGRVVGVPAP